MLKIQMVRIFLFSVWILILGCTDSRHVNKTITRQAIAEGNNELPVKSCPDFVVESLANDCFTHLPENPNGYVLLQGTVLGSEAIYENGSVLIDREGIIVSVGCDAATIPEVLNSTKLICPKSIISPGLINAHDHIQFSHQPPGEWGNERFEHRHQWIKGLDGHKKLVPDRAANQEQVMWGELRQALSGTTSLAGAGGVPGMLRNIDVAALNEGLSPVAPFTTIFPLGDTDGTILEHGCAYPNLISPESLDNAPAFQGHVAEGTGVGAHNEIACLTGQSPDGSDITATKSSFVHFVGATADDAQLIRDADISIIWSPRSNLSLYGQTADITLYQTLGINLALSSDWTPSGSMNILRELKCAASYSRDYTNNAFSAYDLWQMITINAAKSLGIDNRVGALEPGLLADISVFDGRGEGNPFQKIVSADTSDVLLVLRGGEPIVGRKEPMSAFSKEAELCEPLPSSDACGNDLQVCVAREYSMTLADLIDANKDSYDLTFCSKTPDKEPTCTPFLPGHYDGKLIPGVDSDGDGINDDEDNCPNTFNPVRALHKKALQGDWDQDGEGDSCDSVPFG